MYSFPEAMKKLNYFADALRQPVSTETVDAVTREFVEFRDGIEGNVHAYLDLMGHERLETIRYRFRGVELCVTLSRNPNSSR